MPRLICVLPCETVIIANDNKVSMISLFENLMVGVPPNAPTAPNTVVPMKWFAVSIFERENGDDNREFETHIEFGHVHSATARFRFGANQTHRVIHQVLGFPLTFGELRIRAFIGEVGQTQLPAGDFPVALTRLPQGVQ